MKERLSVAIALQRRSVRMMPVFPGHLIPTLRATKAVELALRQPRKLPREQRSWEGTSHNGDSHHAKPPSPNDVLPLPIRVDEEPVVSILQLGEGLTYHPQFGLT